MSNSAVVAQKNPFGLRIGWQVKITTDDIGIFHQLKRISATAVSWQHAWIVGASDSSDAIVNRNDPPRRSSVTRNSSRCATFVAMVQTSTCGKALNKDCPEPRPIQPPCARTLHIGVLPRGSRCSDDLLDTKTWWLRCMIDTRMASMPIWAQGEDDHSGAPRDLISQISNSAGTIRSALGRGTQHGRPGKISAPRSKAESSLCSGRYAVVGYFECGG